jgi:hypothetical protein
MNLQYYKSKFKNKILDFKYKLNAEKVANLVKKLSGTKKLFIFDIGAGNRYLKTLLNFDGTAKIIMVDPHKSLEWSVNNLKKKLKNKNELLAYRVAIGKKTQTKQLYLSTRPTGSTLINIHKIATAENGNLKYVNASNKYMFDYNSNDEGKLIYFKNNNIETAVTSQHKLYVKLDNDNSYSFITAQDLLSPFLLMGA